MLMGRLMGSTSVEKRRKWLFCNFGLQSSRGRLIGSTHAKRSTHGVDSQSVPAKNFVCRSVLLAMSRLMGLTQKYKPNFLTKYTFKNIEIASNRLHIFCSCSWGFRIRFDKIMILSLKYNKSFSKLKSLVISLNIL